MRCPFDITHVLTKDKFRLQLYVKWALVNYDRGEKEILAECSLGGKNPSVMYPPPGGGGSKVTTVDSCGLQIRLSDNSFETVQHKAFLKNSIFSLHNEAHFCSSVSFLGKQN